MTASNRVGSTFPRTRRMVDSDRHRSAVPNSAATSPGASAARSATATNDRVAAATAHTRRSERNDQAVADTAPFAGIHYPTQHFSRTWSELDRIG